MTTQNCSKIKKFTVNTLSLQTVNKKLSTISKISPAVQHSVAWNWKCFRLSFKTVEPQKVWFVPDINSLAVRLILSSAIGSKVGFFLNSSMQWQCDSNKWHSPWTCKYGEQAYVCGHECDANIYKQGGQLQRFRLQRNFIVRKMWQKQINTV